MNDLQLKGYLPEDAYDTIRGFFKDMGERATLEAYRKYAGQDKNLRDETLHIGEATVRLKWHKGRILAEMEKAQGKRTDLVAECNQVGTPTYSELGINKMQASREQLVKRGEWLDWLAENCPEITRMTANNYMRLYQRAELPNTNLSSYLTPMQAYKALGIVRDAIDITEILEPLPPPQGTYHTIVIDPPWEVWKMLAKVGADRVFADLFGADVG